MTELTNIQSLEEWALNAAQELQEFVDDAEKDSGDPNCLQGTRQLIAELDLIIGHDTTQVIDDLPFKAYPDSKPEPMVIEDDHY